MQKRAFLESQGSLFAALRRLQRDGRGIIELTPEIEAQLAGELAVGYTQCIVDVCDKLFIPLFTLLPSLPHFRLQSSVHFPPFPEILIKTRIKKSWTKLLADSTQRGFDATAECAEEWTFRYGAGATIYPKLVTSVAGLKGHQTRVRQEYTKCRAEVGTLFLLIDVNTVAYLVRKG